MDKLSFKQIVAGHEKGRTALYGLSDDGIVYEYIGESWKKGVWEKIKEYKHLQVKQIVVCSEPKQFDHSIFLLLKDGTVLVDMCKDGLFEISH